MWVCPKGRGMPRCHGPYLRFPRGDPEKPREESSARSRGQGQRVGQEPGPALGVFSDRRQAAALVLRDGASSTGRATSECSPAPQSPPSPFSTGPLKRFLKEVHGRKGFPGGKGSWEEWGSQEDGSQEVLS